MITPGEELRAARHRARLSLRALADRTGMAHSYLSKVENGRVTPSWGAVVRIAEGLDCEPQLRLLPSTTTLAARVRAIAGMTPQQRLAGYEVDPEDALRILCGWGLPFVVTGAVAGVLHGLPMTITEMTVLVPDDEDTMASVVDLLMRGCGLFREVDAQELREMCAAGSWSVGWCEVRFEFVEQLPDATEIAVGPLRVQVIALTTLVAKDPDVADIFDIVRGLGPAG